MAEKKVLQRKPTGVKKPVAPKKTPVKKVASTKKTTHVALLLDSSGSMSSIVPETISGFNEQVKLLKANASKDNKILVTLITFGEGQGEVLVKYIGKPVADVEEINDKTYRASGMTPMYDAVGTAISKLQLLDNDGGKNNTAFLVVTISDGHDTYSKEWTPKQVATKIKDLQDNKDNWTFVYIGANQDLSKVAVDTGITHLNTRSFVATKKGTVDMYASASSATENYLGARASGIKKSNNFWDGVPEVDPSSDEEDATVLAVLLNRK